MDPLWASIAEFWWIGPTAVGAGTLGWLGLRRGRRERRRRIELDAARLELRSARRAQALTRARLRVARAELTRLHAERSAGRGTGLDLADARRELDVATAEARAASATARARRAHVSAARAALPSTVDAAALPVARLLAVHDELTGRWMAYETDPARLIAFPAMTDARQPLTAAFLAAERTARELRPASAQARVDPQRFSAYREAVAAAGHAFEAAEAEAWRQARAAGDAPPQPRPGDPDARTGRSPAFEQWTLRAQNLTQTVIAKGSEALAQAMSPRPRPTPQPQPQPQPSDSAPAATPDEPGGPDGSGGHPPRDEPNRVWPVPRRPRA